MDTKTAPTPIVLDDLTRAEDGSYYTILGAGGPIEEWTGGLTGLLTAAEIGTPTAWYVTTGAAVNDYAQPSDPVQAFQPDLTILLFPTDGLDIGRLAMFRLLMGDYWFDDLVAGMRPHDEGGDTE